MPQQTRISRTNSNGKQAEASNSQQTESTADKDNLDKFNDSESQRDAPTKQNVQSIDYKESSDANNNGSAFKSFQFVSVVMEPSKKNAKSMKARDKTKPLIDANVLERQIQFYVKLVDFQKQMSMQSPVEFEEVSKSKNKKRNQDNDKVQRGNLGFCYMDMSLINLCGIPSLWIDQRQFTISGSYVSDETKDVFESYIKPFQKNLLKKQYKVYTLLRFHKIFENDKYFGKNINLMINSGFQNIIQDYWQFSTETLKENNKYQQHQIKLMQKHQDSFNDNNNSKQTNGKDKKYVLAIVQGSQDVIPLDIPKINDPEPAYFKLINSEARILKQILQSQNIQQTDQNEWNLLWTSISLQSKPQIYEQLHDYQKINHFMNSVELTRKDRFAENILMMKNRFGYKQFDFVSETYTLPEDLPNFQHRFNQLKNKLKNRTESSEGSDGSKQQEENLWIYKPSQSSQGKGIYLIQEMSDLQLNNDKAVICRYISNPLLVNHHKFDLRIYVLVTSVDPLRIYIYNEGLVRFASCPYDNSKAAVKNLYQHLTNYSINKKSDTFSQNKSLDERDHGNKWSLSDLQTHLEKMGIHMQPIWERIYDSIIKSIISVEPQLLAGCKKIQNKNPQNCFELFGFDIILDQNFKPYILEVNFSPSLSADSPLDYHIKSNLLVDTLNIVGLRKIPKKRAQNKNANLQRLRQGLQINSGQASYLQMIQANQKAREVQRTGILSSKSDMSSFTNFLAGGNIDHYFLERLSRISAKHRELVFETLDEFQRNKNMNYTCIFPSAGCQQYDKFFEGGGRQSNQLIHKYLFTKNELYALTKQICDYQKQCLKSKASMESDSDQDEEENENDDRQSIEERSRSTSPSRMQEVKQVTKEEVGLKEKEEETAQQQNQDSNSNSDKNTSKTLKDDVVIERKQSIAVSSHVISEPQSAKLNNKQQYKKDSYASSNSQTKGESEVETPVETKLKIQTGDSTPNKVETIQSIKDKEAFSSIYSPKSAMDNHHVKEYPEQEVKENTSGLQTQVSQTKTIKSRNSTEKNTPVAVTAAAIVPITVPPVAAVILQNIPAESKSGASTSTKPPIVPPSSAAKQPQVASAAETITTRPPPPKPLQPVPRSIDDESKTPATAVAEPSSPAVVELPASEVASQSNTQQSKEALVTQPSIKLKSESKTHTPLDSQDLSPKKADSAASKDPPPKKKQKMVITGDDILIEYVSRISRNLQSLLIVYQKKGWQPIERVDDILPQNLKQTLEKFAMHNIWSTKLSQSQKQSPLVTRINIRHKEMVDRRTKILTTLIKKNNPTSTQQTIVSELTTQDINREKIISRIQSQKIEKMVKQSNVENQIDIVSILVEGLYNLPEFLQVSGGKTQVHGTLSSLKMFEKILKSEKVGHLELSHTVKRVEGEQFMSEAKPSRDNSQLFVPHIIPGNSNTQLLNKSLIHKGNAQLQSASKAEGKPHGLNHSMLPDTPQKRIINSGSASKHTSHLHPGELTSTLTNQSISEPQKQYISRQMMAALHQKNSSTFLNAQNQYINQTAAAAIQQQQQPKVPMASSDPHDPKHSFDKRQRSYRNDSHILNMTHNQKTNDQYFYIPKEMLERMMVNNQNLVPSASDQNHKSKIPSINEAELNMQQQSHKHMTPQVYNYQKSTGAYKNMAFSPTNQHQVNPNVSTSAISIVKAGDNLDNTYAQFNRSHQEEKFLVSHQNTYNQHENSSNYNSNNPGGGLEQTPLKQHENKRGSSHSHHTGGGKRSSFKNNTSSKFDNPLNLQNANSSGGGFEFQGQPNHTSNNRLMSFDSQQTGTRQISTTINAKPAISLAKQMQQMTSANSSSKQQLYQGITLPQIAQSNQEQHKTLRIVQQTSHKDLKAITKKQI